MSALDKARERINVIDKQMAELFIERMDCAKEVALYKKEHGLQIEDPVREKKIIEKNSQYINDERLRPFYVDFLESNIKISKNYQRRLLEGMRVAFSGTYGAFANIAVNKIFPDAIAVPCSDFKAAYDSVVNGECDCAVLPIKNSYNGEVEQVLDLAFFGSLHINGVYDISIVQNLIGVKGTDINKIKTVISHPQALGQCANFIKKHGFKTEEALNTALAAQKVAELNRLDVAAIGSDEAAKQFSLEKIETHINESNNNTTQFAVFSKSLNPPNNIDNHFILLFTVTNEAGSLGKAISIIGDNGFNLKSLISRPTKELVWEYYFYAEGEGNINSSNGKKMLEGLRSKCSEVKLLGCFEKEKNL